ncbi:hypothetical protein D3C85_1794960 [compost metagenome]
MFSTSTAISASASMAKQSTTNGARRLRGALRTTDSGVRDFRPSSEVRAGRFLPAAELPEATGKFLTAAVLMQLSWL